MLRVGCLWPGTDMAHGDRPSHPFLWKKNYEIGAIWYITGLNHVYCEIRIWWLNPIFWDQLLDFIGSIAIHPLKKQYFLTQSTVFLDWNSNLSHFISIFEVLWMVQRNPNHQLIGQWSTSHFFNRLSTHPLNWWFSGFLPATGSPRWRSQAHVEPPGGSRALDGRGDAGTARARTRLESNLKRFWRDIHFMKENHDNLPYHYIILIY